ncbi:hypothetical protein HFN63_36900 [Rhizobium leguminosarum]|uniref:hypothetical protein n=1 Tax=Rhizobium leguminosarum TaxID=384 RepID=UPI001C93CF43|nr:hypothetical protein [Rhizobium leguminosarum]MBY5775488.1 hypothetical protein [Rhizobium leguminosarum]
MNDKPVWKRALNKTRQRLAGLVGRGAVGPETSPPDASTGFQAMKDSDLTAQTSESTAAERAAGENLATGHANPEGGKVSPDPGNTAAASDKNGVAWSALPPDVMNIVAEHLVAAADNPLETARDTSIFSRATGQFAPNSVRKLNEYGRLANEIFDTVIPEGEFPDPGPRPSLPADLEAELDALDPWDWTDEQSRRESEAMGDWKPASTHFRIYAVQPVLKFVPEGKKTELAAKICRIRDDGDRAGTIAAASYELDDFGPKACSTLIDGAIDILRNYAADDHCGHLAVNSIFRAKVYLLPEHISQISEIVAQERPGDRQFFPHDRSVWESINHHFTSSRQAFTAPSGRNSDAPAEAQISKEVAELRIDFKETSRIEREDLRFNAIEDVARATAKNHDLAGKEFEITRHGQTPAIIGSSEDT